MNLPNALTLSRIPLMFLIAACLIVDFGEGKPRGLASLALLLFILAALTDWLDGHYARKAGVVTRFGIFMDALSDKIFMLGVMTTLVAMEPFRSLLFPVLVILSRELLVTGLRLLAANQGVVVAAEKAGKQKTVTQIVATGLLLLGEAIRRDLAAFERTAHWVHWAGMGLFLVATFLTVQSGVGYVLKYRSLLRS